MKTFKSKIGNWLVTLIVSTLGVTTAYMIYMKTWPGVLVLGLTSLFILHLFLNTYYQVIGTSLRIKCGIIIDKTIDVSSIRKIEDSKSIFSAPALSHDRLEILYNKFDSVVISPENKEEFARELKTINPNIELKL
ncbi:MAG: PH domain-containing protein [Cyclobacteriaceae bacterium]|jgi:hypothetical protein|nr:PH domain-containing protein [Cyclobacteriaceae bacterium]